MTTKEMKANAREQIKGNIGILFVIWLVYTLIIAAIELLAFVPFLGSIFALDWVYLAEAGAMSVIMELIIPISIATVLVALVVGAFQLSFAKIFLGLAAGKRPIIKDAFGGFRKWGKAVWLCIITTFLVIAWSLIGFAPAIGFAGFFGSGTIPGSVLPWDFFLGLICLAAGAVILIVKAISYSQAFFVLADNPNMTAKEALNESSDIMDGRFWSFLLLILSFIGWILLGLVTLGIAFIWVGPYMYATLANYYNSIKGSVSSIDNE